MDPKLLSIINQCIRSCDEFRAAAEEYIKTKQEEEKVLEQKQQPVQKKANNNKTNKMSERDYTKMFCSFCGRNKEDVNALVAGPNGVFICDECVVICKEILDEEQG